MVIALHATEKCPTCRRALKLRRSKLTGGFEISCTGRGCSFAAPVDDTAQAYEDLVAELKRQIEHLGKQPHKFQRQPASSPDRALIDRLIFQFHPDRAGESVSTHDLLVVLTEERGKS